MICCKCKRALSKVLFYWNGEPIGPTCAAKLGRLTKAPMQRAKKPKAPEIERCPLTLDMFSENNTHPA